MGEWWMKIRKILIVMVIIGIILSLFLVSAFSRVTYEDSLGEQSEYNEKASIDIFIGVFPNDIGKNISVSFAEGRDAYIESLKIFWMVYAVVIIIAVIKFGSKKEFEKIEHGSGDWCRGGEQYKVLSRTTGMILAEKNYLPVLPKPPEGKNGNVLIIGGSGSGKTAAFAIPNAFQMLGSYIFTDPKGEMYDRTAGIYKKNGYEIHVINLADPKYSDGYNPLSHIRNTTDVDIIAKIISKKDDKAGGNKGDPFWDQTSEALLKAMMYYILLNRPEEEHSLASCLSLVRLGGENEGEDLINLFMALPFENPARRAFETIRLGSEKTFSNILVSLAAKLEAFDSEEIVGLTSTNTIDFEELAQKKSVVYFITPESHSTYDFIMNIFFSQLFQRLYEFGDKNGGALPTPVFLILDEFANIGRIPNFERILSTCRSKKLHISIIVQSIDQLMEIYDEKVTENILANCSTHLFLGTNAQKTLESFSKQLGEKTITRDSVSINKDKDSNTTGRGYSDQAMARALMTPDELRRMNTEECIILIQGIRPIKAKKLFYFKKHPLAPEAKECEISHLNTEETKRGSYKTTNPYEILNMENDLSLPTFDDAFSEKKNQTQEVVVDGMKDIVQTEPSVAKEGMKATDVADGYDLQAELEKRFDELFGTPKNKKIYTE